MKFVVILWVGTEVHDPSSKANQLVTASARMEGFFSRHGCDNNHNWLYVESESERVMADQITGPLGIRAAQKEPLVSARPVSG